MPSPGNEISYDARITNLLTKERYSLAEVIARHARASGMSLDEADAHIKSLINNPVSNLRVLDVDELDDEEDYEIDSARAQVATQTLLAATTMLDSNIPTAPMQERLRRLAHAAVEELELFYFGSEEEVGEEHNHGHDDHGHDHHRHEPHGH